MMKSTTVGILLTFLMSSTGIRLLNVRKVFIFVTYFSSATVYLKVVCKFFQLKLRIKVMFNQFYDS